MRPISSSTTAAATLVAMLTLAGGAAGQPPPMSAKGCCCAVQGKTYTCSEKTQGDCMAEQPEAPMYPKMESWKKAYDEAVKASETQEEAKGLRGGWIAGPCEK